MTFQTDATADPTGDARRRVIEAALPNVAFDGWTDRVLAEAIQDADVEPSLARMAFPRGGIDLALGFHQMKDRELARKMAECDFSEMRYSDRVARAIEMRLELIVPHRDAVRRAAALLALPIYAADGARAIWQTADTIWNGLGDTSDDVNWYTKRATLSGVYSASLLYWLGDDSPDMQATRAFIGRRIGDVMQFEKAKSEFRKSPLGRAFEAGPGRILSRIRKPGEPPEDLPGSG